MRVPTYQSCLTQPLFTEARQSTPGLHSMLVEDPDQWEPVFKEVIEQTRLGAQAALEEIQSVPPLKQARETALMFLEGGLVAGVFEGLASRALRQAEEQESLGQAMEVVRRQVDSLPTNQLPSWIEDQQEQAQTACDGLLADGEADGYRQTLGTMFLQGYAVGIAEAALVVEDSPPEGF